MKILKSITMKAKIEMRRLIKKRREIYSRSSGKVDLEMLKNSYQISTDVLNCQREAYTIVGRTYNIRTGNIFRSDQFCVKVNFAACIVILMDMKKIQ